METICFSRCLDYNNHLITRRSYSNESISNIDIRTLIKALDLAHCAARTVLTYVFKHI